MKQIEEKCVIKCLTEEEKEQMANELQETEWKNRLWAELEQDEDKYFDTMQEEKNARNNFSR